MPSMDGSMDFGICCSLCMRIRELKQGVEQPSLSSRMRIHKERRCQSPYSRFDRRHGR